MNTFIEEIATVFGWSKSDYAEKHLLDYYRAHVTSKKNEAAEASLLIAKDSVITYILQDFVRLYSRAEKYMNQGIAFVILSTEHENRKVYVDFKTLAHDANRKRARFENDLEFAGQFRDFTKKLHILPFITM